MPCHFFRLIAALSLVCITPVVRAADKPSPGKAQQLTSPDQVPEGLQKSDWQNIRAAHTAWEHGFMAIEGQPGTWQARNPGQQWTTKFDGRGFLTRPREGEWTWGLELESYGRGEKQTRVKGRPEVKAEGQRLSYAWDATMLEWWVNDPRGLEHGYTLAQRPAGSEGAVLELTIATRGTLKPQVSEDALGVLFVDEKGATVINYTGLKVTDADGKALASRFESTGAGRVRLVVEEGAARYPIIIDPIAQQAYVKASQVNFDDYFGGSVAVSGDTVVVGATWEDSSTTGINSIPNEGASRAGAAYVFVRNGTTWSQQAYLKASQVSANDYFGGSVAVSGDTVVVGATGEASSTTGINSMPNELADAAGAAYVFVRSGTTWTQQAYLKASQVTAGDLFGSVAVSGDTVVVGASQEDSSTTGINSTPNEGARDAGAAYVFARSGTTWSQQAYLKASQVSAIDYFGGSVAVSGDTVVVGAIFEDSSTTGINSTPNESAADSGAAYVFVRSGPTWSQQAYLKPAAVGTSQAGDLFGSVAVSGDTVVVGANREASSMTGINSTPDELASAAGAAYVFVRSGTTWTQQAYLKASQVTAGDGFGNSVAVSGDTMVVGAYGEGSSTTGINSTPNELASAAGAAYVFVRSGTTWSQQAYLKPAAVGTSQAGDLFGSVAVSGDTVVVGANREDSSTTGINSTPNEGAIDAGAAYIFTGLGPPPPDIAVEQPAGTNLTDGISSRDFGTAILGTSAVKTFTIKNTGSGDLTGLGITIDGANASDFTVTASPIAPMVAGSSTTFTVRFAPSSAGPKSAALHIVSNDPDENPFDIALTGTGTASLAFAWGENADGQLGDATTTRRAAAVPVNNAGALAGKIVKEMAVGRSHSLALCTDGTLAAWGDNIFGQLGDGTNASSLAPVSVVTAGTPLAGRTVIAIAAGEKHSLALCSDGTLATWGDGGVGQLGNSGTSSRNTPGAVTTSGTPLATKTPAAISACGLSSFVLFTDGTAASWGYNEFGELGNGTAVNTSTTTATAIITAGTPLAGKVIASLKNGGGHCLALAADGTLAAWGRNGEGQIGDNTLTHRSLPVAVITTGTALAGKTVVALAGGGFHSVALCADGTLVSWGYGEHGELGGGIAQSSKVAVSVATAGTPLAGKTVEEITAGNLHTLARCTDGTVAAWGYGIEGQLGTGTFTVSSVPILVNSTMLASGERFIRVFSGPSAIHSLALSSAQPAASIVVEQPVGTGIGDGLTASMGGAAINTSGLTKIFTIKNPGILALTGLAITKDGANAGEFSYTAPLSTTVTPGGSTTFMVTFAPTALGTRNAALHIASNVTGSANPYDIALTGDGVTYSQNWLQTYFGTSSPAGSAADDFDFDGDGLVNLVERAFGLDPTQGSSATLPQGQMNGGNFTVNFNEPAGMTGVVYGAEWSATMQPLDWHTIPDTGTPPQHIFSVPATGQTFVRLKVTGL